MALRPDKNRVERDLGATQTYQAFWKRLLLDIYITDCLLINNITKSKGKLFFAAHVAAHCYFLIIMDNLKGKITAGKLKDMFDNELI